MFFICRNATTRKLGIAQSASECGARHLRNTWPNHLLWLTTDDFSIDLDNLPHADRRSLLQYNNALRT